MEVGSKIEGSAMSDDSQDPLKTIERFTNLVKKNEDELDAESLAYLNSITKDAERMSELIRQIGIYTKVDKNAEAYEMIDIQSLVKEVLTGLLDVVEYRNVTLDVDLPFQKVAGQAQQLKILFQNLISNGIKFNKSEEPRIEISHEEEAEWSFAVSDNGIGMEEKNNEVVFKPFKRLSIKDEFAGNGIGLSICKWIVFLHGGQISFTKNTAGGTTFHFTLSKNIRLTSNEQSEVRHWVASGF